MTVEMEQLALTAYHYRQLDFLRLFRLARSLEIAKRKRKMPVEYKDNAEKGPTNARSACRRLLREVVKYVFPGFEINSNWNNYFVHIPLEIRSTLTYIQRNIGRLEASTKRNVRDMVAHYNELKEHIDGLVYPGFPYQINVRLSSTDHSRYRRARMAARGQGTNIRPPENFYKCALACIQYKALWDRYIDDIIKTTTSLMKEDAKPKKTSKRATRPVAPSLPSGTFTFSDTTIDAVRVTEADSDVIAAITNNVRDVRDERIRNAQSVFDQALERYLQRRVEE
jgi:hypothetical protein